MKALTFLGTGDYKPVTYVWQDQQYETHLFPEAIAHLFGVDELIVFVTPQVREHRNFRDLQSRLGDKVHPVDIPEGKAEAELWEIFDRCANAVQENETILLDVTHAFRSLPLIVFTVAAYLRRTKRVTIQHLLYGAFEARDEQNRAPIFDLTPLLDLLDWLSGAESFLLRSDAKILSERLKQTHSRAWRERSGESLPRLLQTVAGQLASLSSALHLARPRDVMGAAYRLLPKLEEARAEAEKWAPPFAIILDQVKAEVDRFAHCEPNRLDKENLRKQLFLIEHYLRKGLVMQTVTLAREWLVSWVILQRGEGNWLSREFREEIERALNEAARKWREQVEVPDWFAHLPKANEIAQIWDQLTQLRNDVAHCGMREQAASPQNIEQRAKEICDKIKACLNASSERALWGQRVVIDLRTLYGEVSRVDELPVYLELAKELAGEGNDVVLTGQAPIWLYLAVAHALHGKARRLFYDSPTTGEILIFDHSAR